MASEVQFEDHIPEVILEIPRQLDDARDDIAESIAAAARRNAPRLKVAIQYPSFHREPGWLANSIVATMTEEGMAVNVNQFYGKFQEFGTKHQRAQPFLTPAAIEHEPMLIDHVENALEQVDYLR